MKILPCTARLLLASLVFAIVLLRPAESVACTCAVAPLANRYERAHVVFFAKIGKQVEKHNESGSWHPKWAFEAVEVFKGSIDFKALSSDGCGWNAVPGAEYLLFAGED